MKRPVFLGFCPPLFGGATSLICVSWRPLFAAAGCPSIPPRQWRLTLRFRPFDPSFPQLLSHTTRIQRPILGWPMCLISRRRFPYLPLLPPPFLHQAVPQGTDREQDREQQQQQQQHFMEYLCWMDACVLAGLGWLQYHFSLVDYQGPLGPCWGLIPLESCFAFYSSLDGIFPGISIWNAW